MRKHAKMKTMLQMLMISIFMISACKPNELMLKAPTNLTLNTEVLGQGISTPNGNGTGRVNITAQATDAVSYIMDFGDGSSEMVSSGKIAHKYQKPGTNEYTISVTAVGKEAASDALTKKISVYADFKIPDKVLTSLTNNGTKVWIIDNSVVGHVGYGRSNEFTPSLFTAQPNSESNCFYDDEVTFAKDANEKVTITINNYGQSAIIGAATAYYGLSGTDNCYNYNATGTKTLTFATATSNSSGSISTRIQFSVPNKGFVYLGNGSSTYEILSITANSMTLRSIGIDGNAWYLKLRPKDLITTERKLVWSEEFEKDSVLNTNVWNYDIGNGVWGWGNNEKQYYTDRPKNIAVANGVLKITALKETLNGYNYTSARIQSKNKYSFKYGRIDFRAKLPTGVGTWPTLWLMGGNIDAVSWPNCGEIDVMESRGSEPNKVYGMFHHPKNYGANAVGGSIMVDDPYNQFHIYSMEWTSSTIKMYVDYKLYYTFNNNSSLPFNQNFYLILNIAMGGNYGGTIDPNFNSASMEVDYIRVYQ